MPAAVGSCFVDSYRDDLVLCGDAINVLDVVIAENIAVAGSDVDFLLAGPDNRERALVVLVDNVLGDLIAVIGIVAVVLLESSFHSRVVSGHAPSQSCNHDSRNSTHSMLHARSPMFQGSDPSPVFAFKKKQGEKRDKMQSWNVTATID